MKKFVILAVLAVAAVAGVGFYTGMFNSNAASAGVTVPGNAAGDGRAGGAPGGAGRRGGGSFSGRAPLTVELGQVTRQSIEEEFTVVGNLIGDATVSVSPRTNTFASGFSLYTC